MTLDEMKKH